MKNLLFVEISLSIFNNVANCFSFSSFFAYNKTPAKAFTPPAETKMGTRPGRAVAREFIGGGVYSPISVLPN